MNKFFSNFPINKWLLEFLILIILLCKAILALDRFSNSQYTNKLAQYHDFVFSESKNGNSSLAPRFNILNDVFFINDKTGWIVGSEGKILFTDDGGDNWQAQTSNVATNLLSLILVDSKNGWAAGEAGIILHWNGHNWTEQFHQDNLRIFEIQFSDRKNGLAMAGNQILTTVDGGQTWTAQFSPEALRLVGAFSVSPELTWYYGGNLNHGGALIRHQKGFAPQNQTPANINNLILDVEFINNRLGWLVGFNNNLLHTSDGGQTWRRQEIDTEQGLIYKIDFTDSLNGWLITQSGEVFQTKDGGKHWLLNHKSETMLFGLHFLNKSHGWIVGSHGTILKTRDGGKTWQVHSINNTLFLSYFKGAYCVIARENIRNAKLMMHIPVISKESAPIAFKLESIDKVHSFRTIRKHGDNWLAEVSFHNLAAGDSIFIPWYCWILKQSQNYQSLADSITFQQQMNFPDSVRKYLAPTRIVQSNHPEIIDYAQQLKNNQKNVRLIVQNIIEFTGNKIKYQSGNEQDALSTLRNGYGVCNGKANLAMALLRALKIPARPLMVANTHFIIEYYLTGYGWVRAETTSGESVYPPENNTVMWIATPEDENASPYNGIVCYWGTDNKNLLYDILYDQAAQKEIVVGLSAEPAQMKDLLKQTQEVWRLYQRYLNQNLSPHTLLFFNQGVAHQFQAVERFQQYDLEGFARQVELARQAFERIDNEQISQVSKLPENTGPKTFDLMQNYPNPFNLETLIKYSLSQPGNVILRIFNVAGQEVKVLVNEYKLVGNHEVLWDATNYQGQAVASGIYFFQLEFLGQIQKREAILLK